MNFPILSNHPYALKYSSENFGSDCDLKFEEQ